MSNALKTSYDFDFQNTVELYMDSSEESLPQKMIH